MNLHMCIFLDKCLPFLTSQTQFFNHVILIRSRYSNFVHWDNGMPKPETADAWGPMARLHGPLAGRPTMTGPDSFLHTVLYPDPEDSA